MSKQNKGGIQDDLARLGGDLDQLAKDIQEEAQHAAEDAVGAQFVAATDFAETLGTGFEYGQRLSDIWTRQWQLGMEDFDHLLRELTASQTPEASVSAIRAHLGRRITHASLGARDFFGVLGEEQRNLANMHQELWGSFRRSL